MQKKVFDTLYGYDKKNKVKEWSIKVEHHDTHSVIVTCYGQVTGKKSESRVAVRTGKNIGKKNETTHFEQAILDAQSKWTKKRDIEKYATKRLDDVFSSLQINDVTEYLPMLAQDYGKHAKKIVFPCFTQPKLDGYRMIYNGESKECISRQGKRFDSIMNSTLYKEELARISEKIVLDGELYVHGGTFEHLGVLRKKRIQDKDLGILSQIEYHVYDIVDTTLTYFQRLEKLKKLFENNTFRKVIMVKTLQTSTQDEIRRYHQEFVKDGYEGTIVRNFRGLYKCKFRSYDLQKYKDFMDGEFKIVDYTHEVDTSGEETNLVVWICENDNGKRFNVRPQGTKEERRLLYKNGLQYIGKRLWIKYFELTDRGVPRFPSTARSSVVEYIREVML